METGKEEGRDLFVLREVTRSSEGTEDRLLVQFIQEVPRYVKMSVFVLSTMGNG